MSAKLHDIDRASKSLALRQDISEIIGEAFVDPKQITAIGS